MEAGVFVPTAEREGLDGREVKAFQSGADEGPAAEVAERAGSGEDKGAGVKVLIGAAEDGGLMGVAGGEGGAVLSDAGSE